MKKLAYQFAKCGMKIKQRENNGIAPSVETVRIKFPYSRDGSEPNLISFLFFSKLLILKIIFTNLPHFIVTIVITKNKNKFVVAQITFCKKSY